MISTRVARVITKTVLLLVGAVVLLVDDDQSGVWQRREHGRTRAQNHRHAAIARAQPGPCAITFRKVGVQHLHGDAKACAQAGHRLRCQTDFRYQQQRLLSARENLFDQCEVDLGLAAAGDAIEQKRLIVAQACADRRHRMLLLDAQRWCICGRRCEVRGGLLTACKQTGSEQATCGDTPAGQADGQFARAALGFLQGRKQGLAAAASAAGVEGALPAVAE